jgi:membrane-associated protease RseP (regulator of RpoE activity)
MSTFPKASLIQPCAVALAITAAVFFAAMPAAHAQQGPTQRWVPQGGHHHHYVRPPVLLGFTGQGVGYGVEVMRVNYGSAADRLGLEPGDVVVGVNGRPVRSMSEYKRSLARAGSVVWLDVVDVRTGYTVTTHSVRLYDHYDDHYDSSDYDDGLEHGAPAPMSYGD